MPWQEWGALLQSPPCRGVSSLKLSFLKIYLMPFKQTVDRRHKFGKAQFKVMNWSDYNASLRRRGDITVWIDEDVTKA